MITQRADLTFKHNRANGRHGWLRLTPAYSIKLVNELLDAHPAIQFVLEPFSGTGTTGLVCAERGVACDLLDINPFLVWLARVKTTNYTLADLQRAQTSAEQIAARAARAPAAELWFPPISHIERWWSFDTREALAKIRRALELELPAESAARDLLLVAFCRLVIEWSNATFNHQSISFRKNPAATARAEPRVAPARLSEIVRELCAAATEPLRGRVRVVNADSRRIPLPRGELYDAVITSPPYPNRMSYIRELRPYMYWLGYLSQAQQAGELDWQAIGGTWGAATSRLTQWSPNGAEIRDPDFAAMLRAIEQASPLLANYVHRYFVDMVEHFASVSAALKPGGRVFYIVGNSKFYDTLVPVEKIFAQLLERQGFVRSQIDILRKRNSKKELIEFCVSAIKP